MVRYKQGELPPIAGERKAELKTLAERPDSKIDYSGIPPLIEEFWQRAVRGPFYKLVKKLTSVRIDADVLDWFKSQGRGYHTRINVILRREMLTSFR
jgi:uncharacterized protein (DUF4415 family)